MSESGPSSERQRLVVELATAYTRAPGPERAPEILAALARLEAAVHRTVRRELPKAPPRRVATAMVLAVHSQPHLASTYQDLVRDGTLALDEAVPWAPPEPLVVPNEQLERAFAISQWEIDDLREEIDRRAGKDLKQARALQWIWTHFGLLGEASPWALFRVLFPGVTGRLAEVALVRRGSQLYAIVDQEPPPDEHLLYLAWAGGAEVAVPPLTTFHSKYVDRGLRRAVARGVGADDAEMDDLLDHMVCLIPRSEALRFLERDQWRSQGPGTLTTLGKPYTASVYLAEPARDAEIGWRTWLRAEGGALVVGDEPRMLFDNLATGRIQHVLQAIYAAMLSDLGPSRPQGAGLGPSDLPLFDVFAHLGATLRPIVDWARRPDVHHQVANTLELPLEPVAERLLELAETWEHQLRHTWLALPEEGRAYTVGSLLVQHLVALSSSLRRLMFEAPDPADHGARWDHRPILLLFTAHYLAEARLERLWLKALSDSPVDDDAPVPPPEDVVGTWFWGSWARLLGAMDAEHASSATLSHLFR